MEKSQLNQWMFEKWQEYDARNGQRSTQKKFAAYLGLHEKFFALILGGKRTLGLESVIQVWKATGDASIFDVTGYSEHKPREVTASEFVRSLSPEDRSKFVEAAAKIKSMALEQGVEINSPAGEALINEILRSVGL